MKKKETDFTEGPILRKLIRFMLPILAALVIQTLYSAVDLLIVGQFATTESVAGVSMGGQLVGFMTYMIAGMATAVTVIIGRFIGEKNPKDAGNVIGSSLFYFTFVTVVVIAVLCIFARPLLRLLNLPEEAMDEGVKYTVICGAGYIFVTAYNLIGSIFRGIGDSKTPLFTVGVACVVNIFADLLLVGVLHMAAAGAAIATIFAQAISVLLSLILTKKRGLPFTFGKENIRPHWRLMWYIIKMAIPLAVNELILGVSFMFLSAILNSLGLVASAAVGVTGKLVNFIMIFTSAFSQALSAFVAQNIGARKLKRAQRSFLYSVAIAVGFGAIMFYFAFFHGTWMTALFTRDTDVVIASADFLKSYAVDICFSAIMFCTCGYLNGCGKPNVTLIQCMIGVAVRIPAAFWLKSIAPSSMFVIGLATPISTVFQLVFCIIYLIVSNKKMQQIYGAEAGL